MPRSLLIPSLLWLLVAARAPAEGPIWLEGESPLRASAAFKSDGWGRSDFLSGRKWLFASIESDQVAKQVPAEGLAARYDFTVATAGKYEIWARLGYEFARSPFRWRVGAAEWTTVASDVLTVDLMAIADFAEVAWLKLGTVDVGQGSHPLEFHIPRPEKPGSRVLFGLDCVCITAGNFRPNGPFPTGANWKLPLDREAEKVVFEFPAALKAPAAEVRRELPLLGTWQIARDDENEIVDRTGPMTLPKNYDDLNWTGIRVPADKDAARPDLAYCHRYRYRTKVMVPAGFAGRSFILRFPNNALMTTVFVNGQRVGFSKAPCASFDCDASAAIKPGAVNEIIVGIKDLYYAIARTVDGRSCRYLFNFPHEKFHTSGGLGPTRFADFPVLSKVRRNGILETPSLIVGGPVYTSDVFCIPSVSQKQLGLEVTIHNPTSNAVEVEVRNDVRALQSLSGRHPELALPAQKVTLSAGRSEVVKLTAPWANPKLWWPDESNRYQVETTLRVNGVPVDELRTTFGFREWGICQSRGGRPPGLPLPPIPLTPPIPADQEVCRHGGIASTSITLNGVPWHFRADLRHSGSQLGRAADEAVKEWRKNGQNMVHFRGEQPWTGTSQAETLDYFDAAGIAVRRSGISDSEWASYQLAIDGKPNAALFDNWRLQVAAWVKAERNHPSVVIWSLESEIASTNARNQDWKKLVEPELRRAAAEIAKLDPTRPVLIDGGNALLDQPLSVAGNRRVEREKRNYPDEAYTLAKTASRPQDKPLVLDESFFANGSPPADYAEIIGDAALFGRREAAARTACMARMLAEGYRWHGVAAVQFGIDVGPNAEHHKAWQPVAVLCKEWNATFPAGTAVSRTMKVFNDTHSPSPITVYWLFQTRNAAPTTQLRGKKTFAVAPGASEEFSIELTMPTLPPSQRADAELIVTCERDGKQVFLDRRAIRILGEPEKLPATPAGAIALWDPANKVAHLVRALTAFTPVLSPDELPKDCRVLVVGPDAVTAALARDPKWKGIAARGIRIVVLDQTNPLHAAAVPCDVEPTAFTGRIAFPENLHHPIFAGLSRDDFAFWSNGHVVYKSAYKKPNRGGRSLVQCDVELGCSALVEVPVGDGLLLLSQLAIGDKPADPVARRMTANLIRYALDYKPNARLTGALLPENDPRRKLLADSGLQVTPVDDLAEALEKFDIVVLDATPKVLNQLVGMPEQVKKFTEAGRWLMLWSVTPEGLADFNKLVGFDHAIRPFQRERVRFPLDRDPLVAGLARTAVALESVEKNNHPAGARDPADDTFSHVVDLDDIAPFARPLTAVSGWPLMTNGLTSADSAKFVFYHDLSKDGARPLWSADLPKDEELTGLSIVVNTRYRTIGRLRVTFDDARSTPVILDLKPEAELVQAFAFAPRNCRRITIEPLGWSDNPTPAIGIDNLTLKVRRPADFAKRVVPLLNIGALVKYPQNAGGILLCQVKLADGDANLAQKSTLVATLLQNLGAAAKK